MKQFIKSRKAIFAIAFLVIVIIGTVIGIRAYNQAKIEKHINEYVGCISDDFYSFENEEDRRLKLNILEEEIDKFENYKSAKKANETVINEYEDKISQMKSFFISYYESKITENTLSEINEIDDKNRLLEAKLSISNLQDLMLSEKDIVLDNEAYEKYKTDLDALLVAYDNRIAEIEVAEQKAKEEAERKAAENAATKAKQNSGSKNNSSSSNNQNNTNTNGLYRYTYEGYDDERGYYTDSGYTDLRGGLYDDNGNRLENDEGWWD